MPYRDKTRNNKWRAKVTRSGKVKTQLFNTKTEAQKWEAEQKAMPLDKYLNGTPMVYSLAMWAEKYLDHSKTRYTAKSYSEKRLAFSLFFATISPTLEPTKLHPGTILKHFDAQAKTRSGHAANKDRKNLIAAWNWARKYLPGWPRENPFTDTDRQTEEKHPRYIPPVEDFWAVWDSLEDGSQDKVMLLAYLHTAARRRELFELTWDDVEFAGQRIRLWTRKRKGGKEFDWIPMTAELAKTLEAWQKARPYQDTTNVFVCESEIPASQDRLGQPFMARRTWPMNLCARVGVQPFGLHALRHLSASILDDKNYPITVIQAILRHRSANTTARYLHSLRGVRTALDDAFRREAGPVASPVRPQRPTLRIVKSA